MHTASEWLSLKQAEQVYPISRRTFWKWISEGRLPAFKPFGRKVLLRRSDIDKVLAATRVGADLDAIADEAVDDVCSGRRRSLTSRQGVAKNVEA